MTSETDDWRTAELNVLLETVLRLRTPDEAAAFFRDLCTRHELDELSHRWAVVRLLDRGLPYREIAELTGASTATVTRINQWLQHGTGGYRLLLARSAEEEAR